MCDGLISLDIKFNICIETHLKNIDDDLALKLYHAGVKLIYVGIETSDEGVKKNAHRSSENNELQIQKVKFLQKIGIDVKAMYFSIEFESKWFTKLFNVIKIGFSFVSLINFVYFRGKLAQF